MKKTVVLTVVVVVGAAAWIGFSKATEARREAAYRAATAPFQRDLPVGMSRIDVEKYLKSRNVDYHSVRFGGTASDTYEIKIAEEPDPIICSHWSVYIALEFSVSDTLQDVHIRKVGTCL